MRPRTAEPKSAKDPFTESLFRGKGTNRDAVPDIHDERAKTGGFVVDGVLTHALLQAAHSKKCVGLVIKGNPVLLEVTALPHPELHAAVNANAVSTKYGVSPSPLGKKYEKPTYGGRMTHTQQSEMSKSTFAPAFKSDSPMTVAAKVLQLPTERLLCRLYPALISIMYFNTTSKILYPTPRTRPIPPPVRGPLLGTLTIWTQTTLHRSPGQLR